MQCPNCKKITDENAIKCECGYQFVGYKDNTVNIEYSDAYKDRIGKLNHVVIDDINMDFISMVSFSVKWALASIPAIIILIIIGGVIGVVTGIGGTIFG
jgi:hypothetical protein